MPTPRINITSLRPRRKAVSMTLYKQDIESRLINLVSSNDGNEHTRLLREIRDLTINALRARG
jgi:hypothetical protein